MKKLEYNIQIEPKGNWISNSRIRQEVNKMFWREGETSHIQMVFYGIPKKRTDDQNAYYFGVIVPMVTAGFIMQGNQLRIGSYKDYKLVHEILRDRFVPEGDMVFFDRNKTKYVLNEKSTAELDTIGFNKYLRDIKTWAWDCLGVDIPDPNKGVTMADENGVVFEMSVEEFLESVKLQENNF